MTYEEFGEIIAHMTDYQKQCDVVVQENSGEHEFFPASFYIVYDENDILDKNHPVICYDY